MTTYRDYTFNQGDYGTFQEVTDASAVCLAIKNIILSRPGNFPFTPSLGIDIEKYLFEFADEKTLSQIKTDISTQIGKYVPNADNVFIDVRFVEDTNDWALKDRNILGITVRATVGDEVVESDFLLYYEQDGLHVYNEVK